MAATAAVSPLLKAATHSPFSCWIMALVWASAGPATRTPATRTRQAAATATRRIRASVRFADPEVPAISTTGQVSDVDGSGHDRDTTAADPRLIDLAAAFLGRRIEQARAAHLDPLGDPQPQREIGFGPQARQQPDERDIGAAGRRILGDAMQRGEHARPDVDALAAVAHIQMDAGGT